MPIEGYPQEGYTNGVWDNANTYAPWDLDQGDTWLNNLAGQFPNENNVSGWTPQNVAMGMGGMAAGALTGGVATSALAGLAAGGVGGSITGGFNPFQDSWSKFIHTLSGKGSKRGTPNFYAPSYQGMPFMPREGLGDYQAGVTGQMSQEAQQNQQQMGMAQQQNQAQTDQFKSLYDTIQGSFYDYNYGGQGQTGVNPQQPYAYDSFTPNYVGQTPYGYDQKKKQGIDSTFTPSGGIGQYA